MSLTSYPRQNDVSKSSKWLTASSWRQPGRWLQTSQGRPWWTRDQRWGSQRNPWWTEGWTSNCCTWRRSNTGSRDRCHKYFRIHRRRRRGRGVAFVQIEVTDGPGLHTDYERWWRIQLYMPEYTYTIIPILDWKRDKRWKQHPRQTSMCMKVGIGAESFIFTLIRASESSSRVKVCTLN